MWAELGQIGRMPFTIRSQAGGADRVLWLSDPPQGRSRTAGYSRSVGEMVMRVMTTW